MYGYTKAFSQSQKYALGSEYESRVGEDAKNTIARWGEGYEERGWEGKRRQVR